MALQIDPASEYGQRIQRRLRDEHVIWLTTVDDKGRPQPSPVWFLWGGDDSVLIYSQPDKPKLRNIAARPHVTVAFNTDATGDDVVVFAGTAKIAPVAGPATAVPAFIAKYRTGIADFGSTPERFAAEYSVPVRVTLGRVRGF